MGNKAILMSIQPKWTCKILNGEKTIEVRKKFPKDYVGWVFIYCTKDRKQCLIRNNVNKTYHLDTYYWDEFESNLNGKVVARFWCDKVSAIQFNSCLMIPTIAYTTFVDRYYSDTDLQKASCLNGNELMRYLGTDKEQVGYAIHITKLKIFDKPRELKEFRHTCKAEYRGYNRWQPFSKECKNCICNQIDDEGYSQCFSRLTKAPQNFVYVEDTL